MANTLNEDLQNETQLGHLLPKYVTRVLARNGITTVEDVRKAYPHDILKMRGLGTLRLKQIESVIFQRALHIPTGTYSPKSHVKDSSLNGALEPATVLALARGGILTAEQLCTMEPKDLLKIRGLGHVKLREIERAFFSGQHSKTPSGRRVDPDIA